MKSTEAASSGDAALRKQYWEKYKAFFGEAPATEDQLTKYIQSTAYAPGNPRYVRDDETERKIAWQAYKNQYGAAPSSTEELTRFIQTQRNGGSFAPQGIVPPASVSPPGTPSGATEIPSFKYSGGEFKYNPTTNSFDFAEDPATAAANAARNQRITELTGSLSDSELNKGSPAYQSQLFTSLSRDPLLRQKQQMAERGLTGSSVEQTGQNELLTMLTERANLGAEGLLNERRQGRLSELAALEQGLAPSTASAMNLLGLGSGIQEGRLGRDLTKYGIDTSAGTAAANLAQNADQFGQTLNFNRNEAQLGRDQRQKEFDQAQKSALPLGIANAGISLGGLNPFGAFNFLKGGK